MSKSFVSGLLSGLILYSFTREARATGGDYGPGPGWLEHGGIAIDQSPEFFWEVMLRRMAKAFTPTEKRSLAKDATDDLTSRADIEEFHEAITKGYIKPADAAAAERAHEQARLLLKPEPADSANAPSLNVTGPEEFDSEFADYHHGALAMRAKQFDQAAAAWKKLLARPKAERHYRSVWATFMLGKLGLVTGATDTTQWFQQCRDLAKEGFADVAGLAADSYGWEARAELESGHREQAAKLYLTQLALGDDTAIISLKALIPDRGGVWGTLSFDLNGKPVPSDTEPPKDLNEATAMIEKALIETAKSTTLRELQTAHVLATETTQDWAYSWQSPDNSQAVSRSQRWLSAVKAAELREVADADRLGWVAYTAGDYASAKAWLKLCKVPSGLSRWLDAKLLRRDGKLAAAISAMQESLALLKKEVANPRLKVESSWRSYDPDTVTQSAAHADLAVLYLSSDKFVEALEQFSFTSLANDLFYVAERLLSADELKAYVDKHYPSADAAEAATAASENSDQESRRDFGLELRFALGRRLVREDRYAEAPAYFPVKQRAQLDDYLKALRTGENAKLPKKERARAFFHAAWLVTGEGGTIMGTSGEPDNVGRYGTVTALERETGKLMERGANNKFVESEHHALPAVRVPVTKEERRRLGQNKIIPYRPDHYRYIALGLVWKAAALLPDNCDELADILNTAGNWMKGDYRGDDEAADKFFQAIERRASKTVIGKAAGAKHWFVDDLGAWSSEELKEGKAP